MKQYKKMFYVRHWVDGMDHSGYVVTGKGVRQYFSNDEMEHLIGRRFDDFKRHTMTITVK